MVACRCCRYESLLKTSIALAPVPLHKADDQVSIQLNRTGLAKKMLDTRQVSKPGIPKDYYWLPERKERPESGFPSLA